jgi:hypothetical protein
MRHTRKRLHRQRTPPGGCNVEVSDITVTPPPVAIPDIRNLAVVGVAAERAGWTVEEAFDASMMLRLHGTSVPDAVTAFEQASRWTM